MFALHWVLRLRRRKRKQRLSQRPLREISDSWREFSINCQKYYASILKFCRPLRSSFSKIWTLIHFFYLLPCTSYSSQIQTKTDPWPLKVFNFCPGEKFHVLLLRLASWIVSFAFSFATVWRPSEQNVNYPVILSNLDLLLNCLMGSCSP